MRLRPCGRRLSRSSARCRSRHSVPELSSGSGFVVLEQEAGYPVGSFSSVRAAGLPFYLVHAPGGFYALSWNWSGPPAGYRSSCRPRVDEERMELYLHGVQGSPGPRRAGNHQTARRGPRRPAPSLPRKARLGRPRAAPSRDQQDGPTAHSAAPLARVARRRLNAQETRPSGCCLDR